MNLDALMAEQEVINLKVIKAKGEVYASTRPNWCRCGKANCVLLPSGNPAWGCDTCCDKEQRQRETLHAAKIAEPETPLPGDKWRPRGR